MTTILIILFAFVQFGVALFWQYRANLWKNKLLIIDRQYVDLVGKFKSNEIDLELATNDDLLKELGRRPNNRFMVLMPGKEPNIHVEMHSANVSVPMALNLLRATYNGVLNSVRRKSPGFYPDENDEDGETME